MRTHFLAFKNAVRQAEMVCGGEGWLTLEALATFLTTQAWHDLDDPKSDLFKILQSNAFKVKSKNHKANQIDADSLIIFGLLHCRDSANPINKAMGFYEILQGGDGAFDKHNYIAAQDRDYKPVFTKMCKFVTSDVFLFPGQLL